MFVGPRSSPKYMLIIDIPERYLTVYERTTGSSDGRTWFMQFAHGKVLYEGVYKDMGGPQPPPLILKTAAVAARTGIDRTVQTPSVHFTMKRRRIVLE